MKYVTLNPQYMLRGWQDRPYAIYNWASSGADAGKVMKLTKTQLEGIELAVSPGVPIDSPLFPARMRRAAMQLLEQGIFRECDAEEGLADYQKYRYADTRLAHVLMWSITGNCNLRCRHCYISSDEGLYGEMTFAQCEAVVQQLLDANIYMVALTGGEPLMRRDFWRLIELLKKNHIYLEEIFTNGVLVTDDFLDKLEDLNMCPQDFFLSYDGVGCHDWMRGVPGTEKSVLAAIRRIKARGRYGIGVTTVVHEGNVDSLLSTYELMKELGVNSWKTSTVSNAGNWQKDEHPVLEYSHLLDMYTKVLLAYKADGRPMRLVLGGTFLSEAHAEAYKIPLLDGCGTKEREDEFLCEASRLFPHLLPDGRLIPCLPMSGSLIEDMAPNILDEGWSISRALKESPCETFINGRYRDLFAHNAECGSCEYRYRCSPCRAKALLKGDFYAKSDEACAFAKGQYAQQIHGIMDFNFE
jgi:radical SAM protein with 4Fe4S-binding SPASM domain